ncbi:MAG: hypothetical protein HQ564_09965 [Candidatus Saganbacteria bacterium]|nr:hypothetical protein [Candidatus Saganbacteria bacterium]
MANIVPVASQNNAASIWQSIRSQKHSSRLRLQTKVNSTAKRLLERDPETCLIPSFSARLNENGSGITHKIETVDNPGDSITSYLDLFAKEYRGFIWLIRSFADKVIGKRNDDELISWRFESCFDDEENFFYLGFKVKFKHILFHKEDEMELRVWQDQPQRLNWYCHFEIPKHREDVADFQFSILSRINRWLGANPYLVSALTQFTNFTKDEKGLYIRAYWSTNPEDFVEGLKGEFKNDTLEAIRASEGEWSDDYATIYIFDDY